MANQNEQLNEEALDFDELEKALEQEFNEKNLDLELAIEDREKIGNPKSLVDEVGNVVWEQFINQVGDVAGEDFIKENSGLRLDLSDDAHIQTAENFAKGKIAKHNYKSREQLEKNSNRYKNIPHHKFRKNFVDPKMNSILTRAGQLKKRGVKTVTDIYTGRQIPTETKLKDGSNNPMAAQREHVKSSAEIYENPSLQMANSDTQLAGIINSPENLQGYTTAERNLRKSDKTFTEMEAHDKNKHWEKANKRAEEHISKKEKEGEERLKKEGRETQKEEFFNIGDKALRSVAMTLLTALMKEILQKLIAWFRAGKRNISTFVDSIKESVKSFLSKLKQHLLYAGNTLMTTIFTAIIGPIVGAIKKLWIFMKQGYKSMKEAIDFFTDPANRNMSFSTKVMRAGEIVIAGLAASGALILGGAIETALMGFPVFAYPIPLLGSLASILGLFFGALISGIIGAIALNFIDKLIAGKERVLANKKVTEAGKRVIEAGNKVLDVQSKQIEFETQRVEAAREKARTSINARHAEAGTIMKEKIRGIQDVTERIKERDRHIFNETRDNQMDEEFDSALQGVYSLLK